ncbi:hypothetical protein BDQ12DRAFT_725194 [Crucibulum laeve]|uniref:Uncharacterized protein n=1 Tax=Crucibulum laeve TaxID=68775 RepID=A0A5C3LWG4_9AGAR|nr:hypothetical protein BDQ12DRAFT_725194 [Crucibulum laeve]
MGLWEMAEDREPRVYHDVCVKDSWEVLSTEAAAPYLPTDVVTTEEGNLKPPLPIPCYFGPIDEQTLVGVKMFNTFLMSKATSSVPALPPGKSTGVLSMLTAVQPTVENTTSPSDPSQRHHTLPRSVLKFFAHLTPPYSSGVSLRLTMASEKRPRGLSGPGSNALRDGALCGCRPSAWAEVVSTAFS